MWMEEVNGKYKYSERYKDHSGKTRKVSVTLNSKSRQAQNDAQRMLFKKIEEKLAKEVNPSDLTFREVAEDWLEMKGKVVKGSTHYSYANQLYKISNEIGNRLINSLTAGELNKMLINMLSRFSNPTIKARYSIIKQVLMFAIENDFIPDDNLINRMRLPRKKETKKDGFEKYLEPHEAEALFKRMRDGGHDYYADIFDLQMQTGMRFGELVSLTLEDIDLTSQKITISKTWDRVNSVFSSPKNKKTRIININNKTQQLIKSMLVKRNTRMMLFAIRGTSLFVFSEFGNPIDIVTANNILKKYSSVTTHYFRHTFITRMVENNVPMKLIAEHVGHSDTKMIEQVYAHFSDKMDKDLKDAISQVSI